MINLAYSLVIEATDDPTFFAFYSPDLKGFTGVGNSIEDCIYKARWGMEEHVSMLHDLSLPVPPPVDDAKIVIQNSKVPRLPVVGQFAVAALYERRKRWKIL